MKHQIFNPTFKFESYDLFLDAQTIFIRKGYTIVECAGERSIEVLGAFEVSELQFIFDQLDTLEGAYQALQDTKRDFLGAQRVFNDLMGGYFDGGHHDFKAIKDCANDCSIKLEAYINAQMTYEDVRNNLVA